MFESFSRGDIMRRIGVNRFWPTFPVGIYETKKGWLGVTTVTPAQWRAFCEMLGLTALRDDPTLFMGVDRLQHVEAIERQFIPKLKQRTAQEWFAEGLRRKIPIVPVPEIGDLIADEEKKARGAIVPVMIGDESGFTAGSMQRLDRHAAATRRSGSRYRRADARQRPCRCACPRTGAGTERERQASARRHSRRRFLDGLGRPDLHADARRSRRRRDQDRGDAVSATGGAASIVARPMFSSRCTRSRCAIAS